MDATQLRTILNEAKTNAKGLGCAVALSRDKKLAHFEVHRTHTGREVMAALKAANKDLAEPIRFGTAIVTKEEPKLVRLVLNQALAGVAKKVAKALKGTGLTKVKIGLEDGTELEGADAEEDGQAAPMKTSAAPPPPAPPAPPSAPVIDPAALKTRLTALVQEMLKAIAADPSRKDALARLAKHAQLMLATNNLKTAEADTDALELALMPAPAPRKTAGQAATQAGSKGAVAYGTSRLIWLATRKRLESDIGKLRDEIMATYNGAVVVPQLRKRFKEVTEPILTALDEELADRLDDAINETDPERRAQCVSRARGVIERYQATVAREPVLAKLDENPFVPLTLRATLNTTLDKLSAAVR